MFGGGGRRETGKTDGRKCALMKGVVNCMTKTPS